MTTATRTALYRLYDDNDLLLYVGIANRPSERWDSHTSLKRWWSQVARKDMHWYECRTEAEAAEADAIHDEDPLYNIVVPGPGGTARGSKVKTWVPPVARRQGAYTVPVPIGREDWDDFNEPESPGILSQCIRWYLRRPGAELPSRPVREKAG